MNPRPLKPQYFQILLALSRGDLHGYAIQRAVLDQTEGQMRLWPATLYRSIGKLEEAALIRSVGAPEDQSDDQRRQYYALTEDGRHRLEEEAEKMARWVRAVRGAES